MLSLPLRPDARPFIVLALPRSRTRWLSEFLTYGPWRCTHEEARHFRGMEDVVSWAKQPYVGSAETAVAPFWRLLRTPALEGVRVVVVRRARGDVATSLRRVMSSPPEASSLNCRLGYLDAKLDQVERRVPGVLSVAYADLATPDVARRVFEFALGLQWDPGWWDVVRGVNSQEPYSTFERYVGAYGPQLRRMAGLAKGAILQDIGSRRGRWTPPPDGIELSEESFGRFLRDAKSAFAEHAHLVGEVPEAFQEKNLPLLHAIAAAGALQVIVARSNGRVFGYLLTELTPSREAPRRVAAVETTFFASGDVPGLGMRLQRETLRVLRAKGVSEVWFRDGTRGDGGRMGGMFRRLGASPAGTLWKLDLAGAATPPAFTEGTP